MQEGEREGGNERGGVWESLAKEPRQIGLAAQGGKTIRSFEGTEQRAGKRTIQVGQRNEHEGAPRPTVQAMLFHAEGPVRPRWDRQLLVAVPEAILLTIEPFLLLHLSTQCRASAVAA